MTCNTFDIDEYIYFENKNILYVKDIGFDLKETEELLDRIVSPVRQNGTKSILLDLSIAKRPLPGKMNLINLKLKCIDSICKEMSVITGKNTLMNITIKFIMINIPIKVVNVCTSYEEALYKLNYNKA